MFMRLVSYASYTSVVMFILFDIIASSSPLCCCLYIRCILMGLLPTGFLNKILYLVSCDLHHLYKLSFPLPKDAPHEI